MPRRVTSRLASLRRTFIREWRLFRKLSQDRLVERVRDRLEGFSKSTLSRLENGKQPYTQPILEALSWALGCEPEDLLIRNPMDVDAIWSILDNLKKASPEERAQLGRVAEALLKRAG